MLHIYHGNGKGKTTAAVGLTVRAAGSGMKTAFVQFLKNGTSSEISQLRALGVTVMAAESCKKFTFQMNEAEKAQLIAEHDTMLDRCRQLIEEGVQLLVLDELVGAYDKSLLSRDKVIELLDTAKEKGCETVLTGREPAPELEDRADYITEMKAVRHPYEKGTSARKGREY